MLLAPYFRTYDLAWEGDPESSGRFRKYLRIGLILLVVFGLLFPLLPHPKKTAAEEAIPPRLARVMIEEQKKPPPPPPKPVELPKPKIEPEKKTPIKPPPVDLKQQARQKAEKQLNQVKDELADLREQLDMKPLEQTKNLTGAVGADSHAERSLITSKVGVGSGGITSANSSRGFGTGAGSLTGHDTGAVASSIARSGLDARGPTRSGNSGKAARSREEIELIFDRNKGAIYSLYSRALRDQPELQGKMVLEFTVSPTGEVTMCRVISSELNDPDLEKKIVARVRLFRFEAKDVETITTTKPIDFFPA
ncbi:MAG: AgmX/PglI C-terminal domain-containing protein [Gammaproteobacteria bacterium]